MTRTKSCGTAILQNFVPTVITSLTTEVDDWPGLPQGVKFDPSDPEIICHLLAKSGLLGLSSHPFINEFITTVNQDDGICSHILKTYQSSHFSDRTSSSKFYLNPIFFLKQIEALSTTGLRPTFQ